MNTKFPAKRSLAVTAAALAAVIASTGVAADDAGLTQRVQTEQNKSAFQQKLERIQESARQRAAASDEGAPEQPAPVDMGDGGVSLPIEPVVPSTVPPSPIGPQSTPQQQAEQDYERGQSFTLEQRQQRRALRPQSPVFESDNFRSDARNRREQSRVRSENKQQRLQQKLRP